MTIGGKQDRFAKAISHLVSLQLIDGRSIVKDISDKTGRHPNNVRSAMAGDEKYLTSKYVTAFCAVYNNIISPEWILEGKGHMLQEDVARPTLVGIPYYSEIPVSAGKAELVEVTGAENAVGSINIAGVTGKYAFPVVGCSMEPIIHAGDIVVVDEVNSWEMVDPDKIYMIITREDRMIKHIETDEKNNDILWCVSPNYKRFSIDKSDIIKIYKVTFYGRLA